MLMLQYSKKIEGVEEVIKTEEKVVVKIKNKTMTMYKTFFDYVKTVKNVRKFEVEDAHLSEVFIAKVGEIRAKI